MSSDDCDSSEMMSIAPHDFDQLSIMTSETDNASESDSSETVSIDSDNYDLLSIIIIRGEADNAEQNVLDIVCDGLTYTVEVLHTTAEDMNKSQVFD